jgi:excisionase family DNA binding protein
MAATATHPEPLLVSRNEAARLLGISQRKLFDLTRDGIVPAIRLGERGVRYSPDALRTFIESQLVANGR